MKILRGDFDVRRASGGRLGLPESLFRGCRHLIITVLWAVLFSPASTATAIAAEGTIAEKVVDALGGIDRLKAVQNVKTTSHSINFGSMNSYSSGGPPVHLSDNEDVALWEPMPQRFKIHSRLAALVPFPGGWDFQEAFDGTHGTRSGPKDYRPGTDPALPGAYVGARLKRLWLDHPQWLLVKANAVEEAGTRPVEGREMPVLDVSALDDDWQVTIDPDTFLPYSVAVQEVDGLRGEIPTETVYGEWREVDGIMLPARIAQFTGGALIRREIRSEILVDAATAENEFSLADTSNMEQVDASDVRWGWSMTHWFLGRYAMGRSAEIRQTTPVALREIREGIFQVTGTSHHNLVIVGPDSLAVIEAPFYPERSKVVLAALRQRWPDKPVKYLVLTHHHTDHVGGMREYVGGGAQLVVPQGNAAFFEGILERSGTGHQEIFAVKARRQLSGLGQPVELLFVPNSHAYDVITVYFPDHKLLFATDIYSPGRPSQPPKYPAELLRAIQYYNIEVEHFIGGHGTGPDDFARFMEFAE